MNTEANKYNARLTEVRPGEPEYDYVEQLMRESFPEEERPDIATLRGRFATSPMFRCCVISMWPDAGPVGLLTYWLFDGLVYVEHFAIDPEYRCRGYGNRTLTALRQHTLMTHGEPMPVVLEVEQPTTDVARRRIAFYERNGWVLWPDTGYRQPSYHAGGETVPMRLMATPDLAPTRYTEVRDLIYREVYKVD